MTEYDCPWCANSGHRCLTCGDPMEHSCDTCDDCHELLDRQGI